MPAMSAIRRQHGIQGAVHVVSARAAVDVDVDISRTYVLALYYSGILGGPVAHRSNKAIFTIDVSIRDRLIGKDYFAVKADLHASSGNRCCVYPSAFRCSYAAITS